MRYLVLLLLVACMHVEPLRFNDQVLNVRFVEPTAPVKPYEGTYKTTFFGSPNLPKTVLALNMKRRVAEPVLRASQEVLGPGATSSNPIFASVTLTGTSGYFAGNILCLGGSNSGGVCSSGVQLLWNPNSLSLTNVVGGASLTMLGTISTFSGKVVAAGVDVSSSGINFLLAGGYVSFNGTTQGGIITTSITAASAGATPGSAAHRIYSDNALDATDYVLSVGNAANAASLVNIAYNGTFTQTANAGGSLAAGNISWTNGGAISTGGGLATVGAVAIAASTSGASFNLASKAAVNTAPTISSGFGTSPSIVSSNGSLAFQINVGTGGVATTGVVGLPTAANGWVCTCEDVTTQSTTVARTRQTGLGTTTTCPIGDFTSADVAGAWVASDKLTCIAVAY